MSQERIEAAAQAIHEAGDWDVAWSEQGWRADCARNEAAKALAAADAVMFSDEAIERAARVLEPDLFRSTHAQSLFARVRAKEKVRAVVAALKGEQ